MLRDTLIIDTYRRERERGRERGGLFVRGDQKYQGRSRKKEEKRESLEDNVIYQGINSSSLVNAYIFIFIYNNKTVFVPFNVCVYTFQFIRN